MHIHDRVKVTIPISPNTCKGIIFHRCLRMMEEREIIESMKDQDAVDVQCVTKKDGNV